MSIGSVQGFGAGLANTSSPSGTLIFTSENFSVVTWFQVAGRMFIAVRKAGLQLSRHLDHRTTEPEAGKQPLRVRVSIGGPQHDARRPSLFQPGDR
jgi:hypothetical protein